MPRLAIDTAWIDRVLSDLVRINSINPSLVSGAPGEAEIGSYLGRVCRELNLVVLEREPEPGRVSVVGTRRGSDQGAHLMLNAHYDTVGVEGMDDPFSGRIANGRLYGRGSYDMKGALAACLGAVKALDDADITLQGSLSIAAVADEEYGSLGTRDLLTVFQIDGAIVTEPTALGVCLAHKGYQWVEVETKGRAAHGSKYELGVDANLRMGRFLHRLEGLANELQSRAPHPLVGPPSLHAATVQGGTGVSTYADRCRLVIERRTVPGETVRQVADELRAIIDALREEDPELEIDLDTFLVREPFEVAPDQPIVKAVGASAATVLGHPPVQMGETPWMDSALFAAAGVDTVVFGPDGRGAHSAEEWVELESVYRCAEILARTAMRYCGIG